jgi:tetratricopeptide (TPR) repeat protein
MISATAELGEIALAQHNSSDAIVVYSNALTEGKAAGLVATAHAALLRKRAMALGMSSRYKEAAEDLAEAYNLLSEAGDESTALQTLVEQATALQQSGNLVESEQVKLHAKELAEAIGNYSVLAELYLLQSAQALDRKDIEIAMSAAQLAQSYALEAVAPTAYISATIAIAEISDNQGDRLRAYETLAVGWVTLGDLLGSDTAKITFEPKLIELRYRWGMQAFIQIKQLYETKRRAVKGL